MVCLRSHRVPGKKSFVGWVKERSDAPIKPMPFPGGYAALYPSCKQAPFSVNKKAGFCNPALICCNSASAVSSTVLPGTGYTHELVRSEGVCLGAGDHRNVADVPATTACGCYVISRHDPNNMTVHYLRRIKYTVKVDTVDREESIGHYHLGQLHVPDVLHLDIIVDGVTDAGGSPTGDRLTVELLGAVGILVPGLFAIAILGALFAKLAVLDLARYVQKSIIIKGLAQEVDFLQLAVLRLAYRLLDEDNDFI